MDWSTFSLGNAAGFIKGQGKQFDDLLRSAATDITVGSITLLPRDGNPGNVYEFLADGTSVNALGLPNPGLETTLKHAPDMLRAARDAKKRLRWSVAGFSPTEYGELANALFPFGDIELNLGCPNVWGDGGQKPIVSFDIDVMEAVLETVEVALAKHEDDTQLFDVKVSPYSDPALLKKMVWLLKQYWPRKIVTCNTFPNGVANIDTPGRFGGIGGNALHPIALGQVAQIYAELADINVDVVGVGGISSGERLRDMRIVGASGVQIGTAFGERGAGVFSDIFAEAMELE